MNIAGINHPSFLNTKFSKGITTKVITDKFKTHPDIKNQTTWIPLIAGSFMQAFYKVYWAKRTHKIEKINDELERAKNRQKEQVARKDKGVSRKESKRQSFKKRKKKNIRIVDLRI